MNGMFFDNPLQVDMSGLGMGGAQATLFLYTPRRYDNQVIRPAVYNFSEDAVDAILRTGGSMGSALNRTDVTTTQPVAEMIRPDTQGIRINTEIWSNNWTFVLVVKLPYGYRGSVSGARGTRTIVMSGNCLDEPISELSMMTSTPMVNPNCRLVVHSRQVLSDGNASISANGMHAFTDIQASNDLINQSLNVQANNQDLYILRPYDLIQNHHVEPDGATISSPGVCALSAANEKTPVQSILKVPGSHVNQILQSLDVARNQMDVMDYAPRGMDSFGGMSGLSGAADIDQFRTFVEEGLSGYQANAMIETGIDSTSIFTIAEVERTYPSLQVQPQRIANLPQYNVLPQDINNPKIAYSSMISSAVSALAIECGLSSISFMFISRDPTKRNDIEQFSFQVVPGSVYLISPPKDPGLIDMTMVGCVESFRKMFATRVAPFIAGSVGTFEVSVQYSNNSETLVNLQLLDWDYNTNLSDNAYVESPNRLGNLSATVVGSHDHFVSNASELNQLVLMTQGKTQYNNHGLAAFPMQMQPQVQMPDPSGMGSFL